MALEQKLSLKLAQKLVMTPSLQQAIKLLQMTRLELEGVLTQELQENPILEENEQQEEGPEADQSELEAESENSQAEDSAEAMNEIDLDAYFNDYLDGSDYAQVRTFEPRDAVPIENTLTREPDLYDHLRWQLSMTETAPLRREIAELIIGNLDTDGFLMASIEEIQALGLDPEAAHDLLAALAEAENEEPQKDAATPAPAEEGSGVHEPGAHGSEESGSSATGSASEPTPAVGVAHGVERLRSLMPAPAAVGSRYALATQEQPVLEEDEREEPAPLQSAPEPAALAEPEPDPEADLESAPETAAGYPRAEVEAALTLVRSFDPPGIACQDLRESLLSQLEAAGQGETLAAQMITEHWPLFLKRQFPAIAKEMGLPLPELEPVVEMIKALETRPGRKFSTERTQYVEPDVVVHKVGDEYVIQLNDDGLPRLRVSNAYRKMLQQMRSEGRQADAQQFIKEKMRSAVWLIKSLDQRQRTIYKVANSIIRQQREFLDYGIDHLRPMVLRDVAEDIGMHESTVSRVVSNKYIHTPRGIFPMKFFFHSGINRAYSEDISSLTVKRKIKHLIADEDSRRPLSDSELMRVLNREGINIARRTVAKYRDELGIPSSTDRKQVF